MQIKLSVSAEDHHKILSSLVRNLPSSPFSDVTLVCEDGQLSVNRLALALVQPSLGALELGEAPLLLLPQHSLQEIQEQILLNRHEQETEEDEEAETAEDIIISEDQRKTLLEDSFNFDWGSKMVDETQKVVVKYKPIKCESTVKNNTDDKTEEEEVSGYGLDDSSDEEYDSHSNQSEIKHEMSPEHVAKEQLKDIQSRYMKGNHHTLNTTWLVVNEKFVFHRNSMYVRKKQKGSHKTIIWECAGRKTMKCMAKAGTKWNVIDDLEIPGAGHSVDLAWVWKSEHHTCDLDYRYIFTVDLKNQLKLQHQENPGTKYKKIFESAKAREISKIPDKELRKRMRKENPIKLYKSYYYHYTLQLKKSKSLE